MVLGQSWTMLQAFSVKIYGKCSIYRCNDVATLSISDIASSNNIIMTTITLGFLNIALIRNLAEVKVFILILNVLI